MRGALKIFPDYSCHDHDMTGYFSNMVFAVPICPDGNLLPFFTVVNLRTETGLAVTAFSLEHVGKDNEIVNTYSLSTSLINTTYLGFIVDSYAWRYDYLADVDILATLTSYSNGIYRYKLTIGSQVYYSDTFEINDFKTVHEVGAGDFDLLDFDEDYY